MSDDLISRRALYDKAATLEAQALDYVGKLIERDGEETSVEWRIWSAILTERTAFKHDVYDAPSAQPEIIRCKDCKHRDPEDKMCDSGHFILWQLPRDDDWFCADAERRTDE